MDLAYSPEQVDLQRRAAQYAELLFTYEEDVESSGGRLDLDVQRKLEQAARDAGLWAMNMPAEWGGAGLSAIDRVIVQEQIGKATNCLWDFPWWPANVLAYGTDAQRDEYLFPVIRGERRDAFAITEPEAGSDPGGIRTSATRVDGGWRIDGEKWFVTCGDAADFLIVHANAGPDAKPTLFLVDKDLPGVRISHTPTFMHTTVFGHPQITLDGVVVGDDKVLGEPGQGFDLTKEWFVEERLSIAARTLGAAERALDLANDWARQRRQFGKPIAGFQMIQAMLADCATEIATNRAFTHQVAWEIDCGADQKTVHAKASMAKLSASEAAGRVADRCVQIFGGRGYDRSYPVERIYREVRVDRIWEGTSEIQRLIVANELIKRGTAALQLPRSESGQGLAYSNGLERLRAAADELTSFIQQFEDRCERENGLPPEDLAAIRHAVLDSGLQAINMPREWGGAGLTILEQVVVQERLGRLTGALWDAVWRPANALRFCTPEQRERYLLPDIRGERRDAYAVTEPGAGSDPQGILTTAVRADGGWIINGEKWFVTVGDVADFLIVLALAGVERAPTLFLVDKQTPGVRITRVPRFMHTFVYEHPEFVLSDVFVPSDAVLGGIGQGYDITRGWFTEERLMIAARTIGAAERGLEEARDWAVSRRQFGKPISDFQMIQAMLADSAVDVAVNRAYTHQVAWEIDAGADRKTVHAKAAIAKLAASEASGRTIDRCVQILGGRGYDRAYAVERLYRELRVDRIWEGTSEVQRLVIANELTKRGVHVLAWPRV